MTSGEERGAEREGGAEGTAMESSSIATAC